MVKFRESPAKPVRLIINYRNGTHLTPLMYASNLLTLLKNLAITTLTLRSWMS